MPLKPTRDEKGHKKPGPRFTNAERQDVYTCVSTMRRRGYTIPEIGMALDLSTSTVWDYLARVDTYYKTMQVAETHTLRQEKMDQYNDLVKEAFEAWERSQEDYEQVVTEEEPNVPCPACKGTKVVKERRTKVEVVCQKCKGTGKLGGIIAKTRTQRGQVGDPRFLQILKGIHDSVCDLLGLNLGNKGGTNQVNILNWDQIANPVKPKGMSKLEALESKAIGALSSTVPSDPVDAAPNPKPLLVETEGPGSAASESEHLSSEKPSTNGVGGNGRKGKK